MKRKKENFIDINKASNGYYLEYRIMDENSLVLQKRVGISAKKGVMEIIDFISNK